MDRLSTRVNSFAAAIAPATLQVTVVHDGTPGGLAAADLQQLREALPDLRFIDRITNRGKGYTLRQGMAAATATYYLYTDIDLPYTTASMVAVYQHLLRQGGVAAGERFSDYYITVPPMRQALSRAHRYLMRAMFRLPVSDSQAGLKGFDESGRQIFLETTVERFLVDLDFISRCRGRVEVTARAGGAAARCDVYQLWLRNFASRSRQLCQHSYTLLAGEVTCAARHIVIASNYPTCVGSCA